MDLRKFKEVESAALGCHLSEKKEREGGTCLVFSC